MYIQKRIIVETNVALSRYCFYNSLIMYQTSNRYLSIQRQQEIDQKKMRNVFKVNNCQLYCEHISHLVLVFLVYFTQVNALWERKSAFAYQLCNCQSVNLTFTCIAAKSIFGKLKHHGNNLLQQYFFGC